MSSLVFSAPTGHFELLARQRRLLRNGAALPLGARALDVLVALAASPGEVVSREALLESVWGDAPVEENNLSVQVNALRKALGPDAVRTVPGRGYLLACGLSPSPNPAPAPPLVPRQPQTGAPFGAPALIGREGALATLQALMRQARLCTVVGAGGAGKTRLAQAALQQALPQQPHGGGFVDLTPVATATELPGAVAVALGLPLRGSTPQAALCAALAPLQLLVVLDNAEHLVADVAALVAALLAAAPGLRCLVTSQVPLQLPEEQIHRLEGLALPPADFDTQPQRDPAKALRCSAVALFVARAQAADRRFLLTTDNVGDVVDVVRRLDGLPLALELAAARLPLLGAAGLRAALAQRLQVLTQGWRGAPQRQQSLRAALLWSHGLLSPTEQAVFRRLAVFAGSASLGLVQAVLADDADLDRWAVLEALDGLIQRSLLRVLPESPVSEPRYALLESPLALAREQLAAHGEATDLAHRLAKAIDALFQEQHDRLWRGDGTTGSLPVDELLAPDIGHGLASFEWALVHDEAMALRIGTTLSRVLGANRVRERVALCRRMEALLDSPAAAALPDAMRGHAMLQCAEANNAVAQSSADRAQQAAAWLQAAGDVKGTYVALCVQARAVARMGDHATMGTLMATVDALENPAWPAGPRVVAAAVRSQWCSLQQDGEGERHWMYQTAALMREAGRSDVAPLVNLVGIERRAGRYPQAIALGEQVAARLQGTRLLLELAHTWVNLCSAQIEHGALAAARQVLQAAWPLVKQFDLHPNWADNAARLAGLEGRAAPALALIGYADHAYASLGARRDAAEEAAIAATAQAATLRLAEGPLAQAADAQRALGVALPDAQLLALALAQGQPAA